MPFFLLRIGWIPIATSLGGCGVCFFFWWGGGWNLSVYTLEKLAWNPKKKVWKMMCLFISGWFSGSILIFLWRTTIFCCFRIWLQICRICLIIFFGLPLLNLACFCWCAFVRDHSTAYIFGGKQRMQMYGKIWRISSNKYCIAWIGKKMTAACCLHGVFPTRTLHG